MSTADEVSRVSQDPTDEAPRAEGPGREDESPTRQGVSPSSPLRGWSIVLAAGVLAGLAGFGIGEASPIIIRPDLNLPPEIQRSSSNKPLEIERRMGIARDRQTTLAYGG